ncbi:MAG TPA: HEAT repeat domain-containing protein, partial [Planctomycetaceae bacterium]|nr:HEAT repeat domain-containing protein [Planctomycetaceae bacterium]
MFFLLSLGDRLINAAATNLMLLALGSLGLLFVRQPIRRIRVILLTFTACLLAPVLQFLPGLPHWSIPVLRAPRIDIAESRAREHENPQSDMSVAGVGDLAPAVARSDEAADGAPIDIATAAGDFDSAPESLDMAAAEPFVDEPESADPVAGGSPESAVPALETDPVNAPGDSLTPALPVSASPLPAQHAPVDLRTWLVAAYLTGLVALGVWWLIGLVSLRRVLRQARPAPASCRAQLRDIAGPHSDRVRLLVSPLASQPFTFTWVRPVIVLPTGMAGFEESGETRAGDPVASTALRSALAHEWSHVARGDAWVWSLAGFIRLVHYYQPLCWWLRRQLRLSQDYLADAEAARQTTPTEYAEFLATRALGRPLALGLGITAGKSDLYRRVAMLVTNQRPLESHCPWWWMAGAGTLALALVVLTGTFGDRGDNAAAADPTAVVAPQSTGAEVVAADEPLTKGLDYLRENAATDVVVAQEPFAAPAGTGIDPGAPAAAGAEATAARLDPTDETHQARKLANAVLARAEAIRSGRIEYDLLPPARSGVAPAAAAAPAPTSPKTKLPPTSQLVFSEAGRLIRNSGHNGGFEVSVDYGGRSLYLSRIHGSGSTITHELRVSFSHPSLRMGDMLAPATWLIGRSAEFASLREHRDEVQLRGQETIDGIETLILEWNGAPSSLAQKKTKSKPPRDAVTIRLNVAPQLGLAIVRTRYLDRFGLAQSIVTFSEFKEVAPGLSMPHHVLSQGPSMQSLLIVKEITDINAPIPEQEFVLPIPAGTQVTDIRPHRHDTLVELSPKGRLVPRPHYDAAEYPLRNFTVWTDEPAGLPAAVFAEMDRDVLTPEEWEKMQSETTRKADAAGAPKKYVRADPAEVPVPADPFDSSPATPPANAKPQSDPAIYQPTPPAALPAAKRPAGKTAAADKSTLRYADKTFAEWRAVLFNDLDPETRAKALKALGSLGANGMATEAAEAISAVLKSNDPGTNNERVTFAACLACNRLGEPGIAILASQLDSSQPTIRQFAAQALAEVPATVPAAVPVLLKATKSDQPVGRAAAYRGLATHHLEAPGVIEALTRAASAEGVSLRITIIDAIIGNQTAAADRVAPLLLNELASQEPEVRYRAAMGLMLRGPENPSMVKAVMQWLLEADYATRARLVSEMEHHSTDQKRQPPKPMLTARVLSALLEPALLDQDSAVTAIGLFASSLSRSQVVAAIIGAVLVGALILLWVVARAVDPP